MPILSDETIALITEKFEAADKDGSGTLDAAELTAVLTPVAEKEGFDVPSEERIKARLDAMALENEGALTLVELLFIIGYLKVMVICEILFMEADKDGSGVLDPPEIKDVIRKVCEKDQVECPSEEDMDTFICEIGGEVNFEMFAMVAVPRILIKAGMEMVEMAVAEAVVEAAEE